jgi:hypothetical protein
MTPSTLLIAIALTAGTTLPVQAQKCDRSTLPPTSAIVEVVRYQLAPGISDQAHLDAAAAITPFLCAQPGFVRRVLSKGGDGLWIDFIEWESAEFAAASAERAQSEPAVAPFLQSVNPETMDFRYLNIQRTID